MSDQNILTQALTRTLISRRTFLKWSAALGGTAALAGGLDLGLQPVQAATPAAAAAPTQGKWVAAACWHNCGGRCLLKAYVVDGVVQRVRTDDTHADSPDFPQQRACARGRSQRYQVFGADRLKYPMKRKNWAPGGGDKSLRGKDEWIRISWDEALTLVANEIIRIQAKYGNASIFKGPSILNLMGGSVGSWGSTSYGTWLASGPRIGLSSSDGAINDRFDMRANTKLMVMFAANSVHSSAGSPTYNYMQVKKAGAKFIWIDPYYNDAARLLADEWVPIRPATDQPFLMGMSYVLFTEDTPARPLIDWDFCNRCVVGIDKDHLPAGADPEDNYKDYILGLAADGKPAPKGHKNYPAKTPEWASEICGVPANKIRSLAIEIATTKPANIILSYAPARVNNIQHFPTTVLAFGCMTGNVGLPGAGFGLSTNARASNGGDTLVTAGSSGLPSVASPIAAVTLNNNEMWDAILTGKYTAGAGPKKDINIQLIYWNSSAGLQTRVGQTKGIDAFRKVEFVVSHSQFLTTNSKYADVVLPVTTEWEREGTFTSGNREALFYGSKIVDPLFESKDDQWIEEQLAKRLGVDALKVYPFSRKQQSFNQLAGAKVMKADGSGMETLLTITDKDIADWGVTGKPQTGRITLPEFVEKGVYQVERKPGDKFQTIAFADFRKDPVKNKLSGTPSGKFEVYCDQLAKYINGLGWNTIRPIASYDRPTEGYEDTFSDWDKKIKGEYPLQLYTIHLLRRSHTVFDNIPQLRRAFPQYFMMNPIDAAARGITDGDYVLIKSRHGQTIRPVQISQRMMPGVTTLPHGAWLNVDEEIGIDVAGSDNLINGAIPTAEGHQGWNSCNVQVTKWTGKRPAPDYQWPLRIPIKEA